MKITDIKVKILIYTRFYGIINENVCYEHKKEGMDEKIGAEKNCRFRAQGS